METGIVRILGADGGTAGTGFVVTNDGLIATCAHVVEAAGATAGGSVKVVLHASKEQMAARVEPAYWRPSAAEDVAILSLGGAAAASANRLLLGTSSGVGGHPFRTYGFPKGKLVEGLWGYGQIGDPLKDEYGYSVVQLIGATEVTRGFSGAPVMDEVTERIVGMVTSIVPPDQYQRMSETAFLTPSEVLRATCDALQLSDVCPYRGLSPFTETDVELFFGRHELVERLLGDLQRGPRLLAVLGPSGSGKSSTIRAGLLPKLREGRVPRSDRWGAITVQRYEQPANALAAVGLVGASDDLPTAVERWVQKHPAHDRLVLVLDQFEELFVVSTEPARHEFIHQLAALMERSSAATVILIMRDDFYSRFLQEAPALASWLERGLVNIPPVLERGQIADIVREPARAVGLALQDGLVERIVDDTLETVDAYRAPAARTTILPLLEFALTQLWERRHDGMLTHDAYDNVGGVTGGLTQWAEAAYQRLHDHRRLARRIFISLVHLGEPNEGLPDSRWRKPISVLVGDDPGGTERAAVEQVVEQLTRDRLLVRGKDPASGQDTVELIHDALLHEWGMLKDWIKEDRRFLEWRQDIARPVGEWMASMPNGDEGLLLRGGPLSTAERWLSERPELSPEEHKFIAASVGLRERQREEDEARRRKDAEVARNLKWRARILLGAMLLAIGAFFFAVGYQSWRQGNLLGSVSAYYYTPAQAFFIGGLIGLGTCMIALRGTTPVEHLFLTLGGVFAVIVAIVPTGRDADYRAAVRACREAGAPLLTQKASTGQLDCPTVQALADATRANVDNNLVALLAVGAIALLTSLVVAWRDGTLNPQADGDAKKTTRKNFLLGFGVALGLWLAVLIARSVSLDWMIGNGHWIATVLLFLCIFVVAVANARRVQKEESEKRSGGRRVQKEESEGQSGVAPSAKQESLEAAGELFARQPRDDRRYVWIARLMLLVAVVTIALWRFTDFSLFWVEASVYLLFMAFWTVQTFELESREEVLQLPPHPLR